MIRLEKTWIVSALVDSITRKSICERLRKNSTRRQIRWVEKLDESTQLGSTNQKSILRDLEKTAPEGE